MKKAINICVAIIMILLLSACGQATINGISTDSISSNKSAQLPEIAKTQPATEKDGRKALIVYFSWSTSGNTEKMATTIKEQIDADIMKIEPAVAYPTDYNECGAVAKIERDENIRPQISNLPESLADYDTIFIGYPIWWHTAPMIIGTFLESYDLSQKDVYPFAQSTSMNTEQFENSMTFVRENAKGATVHYGLFVNPSDKDSIIAYLKENKFTK